MSDNFRSELLGTAALTIAAIAALFLTLFRVPTGARPDALRGTTRVFLLGIVIHALHFAEEYAQKFFERFPPLLGLSPWSAAFFVSFNLFWLTIGVCSAIGLRTGYRAAFFPAWFFAIAALANSVAHPVLSARTGGYFPRLLTSPLLGVIGVWLWLQLVALTAPRHTLIQPPTESL